MDFDRDLASIQQVRDLVRKAGAAQREYQHLPQEKVDALCGDIALKIEANAELLAKIAVEETGYGVVNDKIIKNVFASTSLWADIKNLKTRGIIKVDEDAKMWEVGVAVGVVAGLVPSTNPTSTTAYKSLISLKSGNAIIFSPHPAAVKCISKTVELIREVLKKHGQSEDLVSLITIPTLEATSELMKSDGVALILATGGKAMVKAAYSSGTPALGVGPGNVPAFIEKSADVKKAVAHIIESKTFDNGVICASEQAVVVESCMAETVKNELIWQGCYFVNDAEKKALEKIISKPDGNLNPKIVGKTAQQIAKMAGFTIPDDVCVLIAHETGVGKAYPFSIEKLSPLLAYYVEDSWEAACEKCIELLEFGGVGHSLSIHTENMDILREFALKKPVSRLLVNTSSTHGGIGATTSVAKALTLGCGAVGGSATSDNVTPMQLINIRRVAFGKIEYQDIKRQVLKEAAVSTGCDSFDSRVIADIVVKVLETLKSY